MNCSIFTSFGFRPVHHGQSFFALCAMVSAAAFGTDYMMNNAEASRVLLKDATNYVGEVAPPNMNTTAGLDDTIVAMDGISFQQKLVLSQTYNGYINSIVGDEWRMLDHALYSGMWWRTLHLRDLSRFAGLVYSSIPQNMIMLDRDSETPAHVPQIDLSQGLQLGVTGGSQASAVVGKASGLGGVRLNVLDVNTSTTTAGNIAIEDPLFGHMSYMQAGFGTISLVGHDEEAGVVGDPYLHLDATVDSSLTWSEAGGQKRVTRWDDARGGERPYAYSAASKFLPWISTDVATGNKIVDFGASACDYGWPVDNCWNGHRTGGYTGYSGTTLGNCGWLKLNEKCSAIREVFVVLKDAHLYNCQAYFLGNDNANLTSGNQFFRRGHVREDENGGKYEGAQYHRATLFKHSPQTDVVSLGDVRLDGQRVMPDVVAPLQDRFHVISVGTIGPAAADRIGDNGYGTCNTSDRYWAVGGFALGEMLIYTNVLTSAERSKVNRYLKRKWSVGEDKEDFDFGFAKISSTATLDVPSGTIRAKKLVLPGNRLVKSGAGTFDGGYPPNAPFALDVNGGSVAFSKPFMPSATAPSAPAGYSDVWLDANVESSLAISNAVEGSKVYVTTINHCQNNGINDAGYATFATKHSTKFLPPTRVFDSDVDKYVFDTGPFVEGSTPSDGTTVVSINKTVLSTTVKDQYLATAGFVVFKTSNSKATIIGSIANDIKRDTSGAGKLLSDTGGSSQLSSEYFALDGKVIDPRQDAIPDNEYHVLSYRFSAPMQISTFGGRNSSSGNTGGVRIGEWIQYDRQLSDAEMRETEAYLLGKWLGKDHPSVTQASTPATVSAVTYGPEADPMLKTDFDMNITSVASQSGTFRKAGSGAVSVASMDSSVTNLSIESGNLAVNAGIEDIMAGALFRFDASDASTLTVAGDGTVAEWRDKNGNGYVARPLNDATFVIPNSPRLVDVAINGAEKKAIDFGTICPVRKNGNVFTVTNDASAFQLYKPDGSTGWSGNMREWFVVAMDTKTGRMNDDDIGNDHAPIISGSALTYRYLDEMHYYLTHPAHTVHRGVNNGYYEMFVDHVEQDYNYRLWEKLDSADHNFHVFSMSYLTNHVDWTFQIRHLGGDLCRFSNHAMFGGQQLCEAMVFETPLSPSDRHVVISYLMRKWLSSDSEVIPDRKFGSVEVASGASLNLGGAGWPAVSIGKIGGGGTLTLGRAMDIEENASLNASMLAANTVECLNITGTLTLPTTAIVNVDIAPGLNTSQILGRYPILSATSLGGGNVSGWTATIPSWVMEKLSAVLEREGNTIYIRFLPRGTVVIFR